jgi:hypothetical protein
MPRFQPSMPNIQYRDVALDGYVLQSSGRLLRPS